jgi:hypothetical protein
MKGRQLQQSGIGDTGAVSRGALQRGADLPRCDSCQTRRKGSRTPDLHPVRGRRFCFSPLLGTGGELSRQHFAYGARLAQT